MLVDIEPLDIYNVDMSDLLGTFEQLVLLAVHGLEANAYGRAVLHDVESALASTRGVSAGAVYTTLDRMEGKGLLSSRLAEGTPERGGRARRYYRLTAAGASALTETRTTMEKMWQGKTWPLQVFA